MALEDFVSGFSRSFQPSIQQGQQAYQFNERQDLRERAQAAKERVQQERIAQLRQQMEQSAERFPEELESMDAEQAQSRAATKGQALQNDAQETANEYQEDRILADLTQSRVNTRGQALQNEAQRTSNEYQEDRIFADLAQSRAATEQSQAATRGQEIRNDRLPAQIDASIDQTRQATWTSAAQAASASARSRYTGTQNEIAKFRLGQAEQAQERQRAARQQVDEMTQTLSAQPQELPDSKTPDPFSIEDVPEAIHNSIFAPAAAGIDQFLGLGTYEKNLKRDKINISGGSRSDEAMNTGRQAVRAEMGTVGALEQQFTNASPDARSPQVAVNALRRIGRVKGKLKENAYGFDAEERKQMMQRIQRQEQLFSRYVPREDPIQRQAQQAFQGAIEEEEYPSAVKALDVIRRMRQPAQADNTGTSPGDFLP